jgi:hypothetical protein
MPFTRPVFDYRRSYLGTRLGWSTPVSRSHREEKGLPVLFTVPHSFLFESKKSDFYSILVPSRFSQISFLSIPLP